MLSKAGVIISFSLYYYFGELLMVLLGVRTMGDHVWGKYAPPKLPKNGRE